MIARKTNGAWLNPARVRRAVRVIGIDTVAIAQRHRVTEHHVYRLLVDADHMVAPSSEPPQ